MGEPHGEREPSVEAGLSAGDRAEAVTPFAAACDALLDDSGLPRWGEHRRTIERRMRLALDAFDAARTPSMDAAVQAVAPLLAEFAGAPPSHALDPERPADGAHYRAKARKVIEAALPFLTGEPDLPAHMPSTVGLCPHKGHMDNFYVPDPEPGETCPLSGTEQGGDDLHDERLVIYRAAPGPSMDAAYDPKGNTTDLPCGMCNGTGNSENPSHGSCPWCDGEGTVAVMGQWVSPASLDAYADTVADYLKPGIRAAAAYLHDGLERHQR